MVWDCNAFLVAAAGSGRQSGNGNTRMGQAMATETRMQASELLQRVQERIDDERLPLAMPAEISAGYGTGAEVCGVCDRPIPASQILYAVISPGVATQTLFHVGCYLIWQRECTHREAPHAA